MKAGLNDDNPPHHQLNAAELCEAAQQRTGLIDFGDPSVEAPLTALVGSLEGEAELHSMGRFLMRNHLRGLLEHRLRLNALWKNRAAQLNSTPIRRPIFITGMPRSGSTFLHELLAEDPDNRTPRVWEVMNPLRANEPDCGWQDTRVWKTEASLWCFRRLVPEADAIYPVRARTPHECVAIHSHTFYSEEFVSSCRVPGYEAFIRQSGLGAAYRFQRRFLQHLQYERSERRWILKSPDHVQGLEALFAAFPDALVIQTHRNPLEVLRSLIQLAVALHRLYARQGDRDQVAERESQVLARSMERFIQFRDKHPELAGRFMDVNYSELTKDPIEVVARIYRQFDIPLTWEARERMRRLAERRTRYPGRGSVPTLTDAGLDVPAQASRFETYCRRYGIALRPTGPKTAA